MTLDYVLVDLSEEFACHQAYVALSRARSIDGLEIRHAPLCCKVGGWRDSLVCGSDAVAVSARAMELCCGNCGPAVSSATDRVTEWSPRDGRDGYVIPCPCLEGPAHWSCTVCHKPGVKTFGQQAS